MSEQVDSDVAVDATIMKVAQIMGVATDRVAVIVDQYGAEYCEAALEMYQEEVAAGFTPQAPMGYLISLLRKGVVQDRVRQGREEETAQQKQADYLFERYHRGRALSGKGPCFCCEDADEIHERCRRELAEAAGQVAPAQRAG